MAHHSKSPKLGGRLIVFEGADESGKTTASQKLVTALEARGQRCLWLAFPGHEPNTLGAEIYALHHDPRFATAPALSVQLMHVAAHVEAIKQQILPALAAGTWVILDRYWWSTLAYGMAAKVDPIALRLALKIEQLEWGKIRPAVVFLFVRNLPNMKIQPCDRLCLQGIYQQIARRERRHHAVQVVENNGPFEDALNQATSFTFNLLQS